MKILLVCLGNICRSPMAQGLLRDKAKALGLVLETDSAGTTGAHAGEAPDPRAQAAMQRHGHDISGLRARQFAPDDFRRFDLLLAMDHNNLRDIRQLAPQAGLADKARAVMDFAPGRTERDVPDPYWGGPADYERVYELLNDALDGVLHHVRNNP